MIEIKVLFPESSPEVCEPGASSDFLLRTSVVNLGRTSDPPASEAGGPHGGTTFLCVDDNNVNRKILQVFCERYGQAYVAVENGLAAVEEYKRTPERFRCILMDISMPVMDGWEATRRIRAFEAAHNIRRSVIIGLTAGMLRRTVAQLMENGFDFALSKPFNLQLMSEILFGGPNTSLLMQHGALIEEERRPYPLQRRKRVPKTWPENECLQRRIQKLVEVGYLAVEDLPEAVRIGLEKLGYPDADVPDPILLRELRDAVEQGQLPLHLVSPSDGIPLRRLWQDMPPNARLVPPIETIMPANQLP